MRPEETLIVTKLKSENKKIYFSASNSKNYQEALEKYGYLIFHDVPTQAAAENILQHFGTLLPQEGGRVAYSVQSTKEFENASFSKGRECIPPHTDGSYLSAPPKALALWCETPPACGKGRTLFAGFSLTLCAIIRARKRIYY